MYVASQVVRKYTRSIVNPPHLAMNNLKINHNTDP